MYFFWENYKNTNLDWFSKLISFLILGSYLYEEMFKVNAKLVKWQLKMTTKKAVEAIVSMEDRSQTIQIELEQKGHVTSQNSSGNLSNHYMIQIIKHQMKL